jgi:2-keto-4-pentenoate hydratase/2-oxohepta-3-ene-1,7-dioic acid hydratase in catechol pathway
LPRSCDQIDWEVGLAVIIGKEGKRIKSNVAYQHIAGFTIINDVSGREAQFSDSQWYRGKLFDTFAPMGPALVPWMNWLQTIPLYTRRQGFIQPASISNTPKSCAIIFAPNAANWLPSEKWD